MPIETVNIEASQQLDNLLVKGMEKEIRDIVKKVLRDARASLSRHAKNITGTDPRLAYQAVNYSVYKQILGGNVNIAPSRKGGAQMREYNKPRTLRPGQVGGNRRLVSQDTKSRESYYGASRGFVLRFLNAGTKVRETRYGRRGSIAARNWFPGASQQQLEMAADALTKYIDQLIQQKINK